MRFSLRSGALRSENVAALSDARLMKRFTELQRLSQLLEAARLRLLGEIEPKRLFAQRLREEEG